MLTTPPCVCGRARVSVTTASDQRMCVWCWDERQASAHTPAEREYERGEAAYESGREGMLEARR